MGWLMLAGPVPETAQSALLSRTHRRLRSSWRAPRVPLLRQWRQGPTWSVKDARRQPGATRGSEPECGVDERFAEWNSRFMRTDDAVPLHDEIVAQPNGGRSYSVRAVERVCEILDLLQRASVGVSLAQVADATSLPKSSAFRYLWTLEQHRYVERDEEAGTFRLGTGIVGMVSSRLDILTERARVWLEELRNEIGETVNLGVLEGHQVVYLAVAESTRAVRLAARVGDLESIHSTALGKALVSEMPEETVRRILNQRGMPKLTASTITDPDAYLRDLHRVRRMGYALDNGENEEDGRCVAVVIRDIPIKAAVSLSAPASRFPESQVETVAQRLEQVAGRIERDFRSH